MQTSRRSHFIDDPKLSAKVCDTDALRAMRERIADLIERLENP